MANARMCDRCKTPFTIGKIPTASFENPRLVTDKKNSRYKEFAPMLSDVAVDDYVDLCPDCTKAFVQFMAGEATEEVPARESDAWDEEKFESLVELFRKRLEKNRL